MGLLQRMRACKQREREMRILVLGLDNAGKTTIIKKFNGEDVGEVAPTLGFQINTLYFQGYKLVLWDVGGQASIRTYWRNFFEKTDGLIWVVDSSDVQRLEICRRELHELLRQEKLQGAALLVYYNKSDIEGSLSLKEISQFLQLESLQNRDWAILPSSGITGSGLEQGIVWLVSQISQRVFAN